MKKLLLLFLMFYLTQGLSAIPQFQIFKLNRTDKKGERHGKWKTYWDDERENVYRKGKFKHGVESGKWKYYDEKGNVVKTEKYVSNRKIIITKNYFASGRLESEGEAHLLNETDGTLHYFWQGTWRFYSQKGEFIREEEYVKGKKVILNKAPYHNE